MVKKLIQIFGLLIPTALPAQSWLQINQYPGAEKIHTLATAQDGGVFIGGTFQNRLSLAGQTFISRGNRDLFVGKIAANGNTVWAKQIGGIAADEITALTTDAVDNVLCAGNFRLAATFDTLILTATTNPRAIFLAKYDASGRIIWVQAIDGAGLKDITALTCDPSGNIFATGFFEGTLNIGDTLLQAAGRTDLFVAKFSPAGRLQWALRQGQQGDTRGLTIGLTRSEDIILAGYFNDTTRIADTVLTANTADRDLFITRINKDGQPRWAKKAGGVFDKDVTALTLDEQDNIYLTGYLVGVMRLSADLAIQSATGRPDFFVVKYSPDGTPLRARALGGTAIQQAMDICWLNGQLIVGGFYQGDMRFDGFQFSAVGNNFNGFVAIFDTTLICRQVKDIAAAPAILINKIAAKNNAWWVGGSFIGQATFNGRTIQAPDYEAFLAKAGSAPTPTNEQTPISELFLVFPNPTKDVLLIQTTAADYQLQLFDIQGKMVRNVGKAALLDLRDLPSGVYWLQMHTSMGRIVQRIVKE